jgi:ABC-type glycerol-3-phosphate transport system substrate-binding protein
MNPRGFASRIHLLLALVAVFSLVLTACVAPAPPPAAPVSEPAAEEQPPAEAPTEEPAEPAEAVIVELFHDKPTWGENIDKMGQSAGEAIGVGFANVPYNDPTTFQPTVRAALTTDQAPDLYTWWSGYRMEDIVEAGGAADLTDIWQKYIDSGEYSQGVANAFAFDGKVYAVPFLTAYWVVYYNKPLFEENGLAVPTTWDEFIALNDALVAKGIKPLAQTFVDRWQAFIIFEEMILRTQGPEFYDRLMRGEAKYTDPEVVEAMELWKELMDKGYLTSDYAFGTATDTFLPAFQAGDVAMVAIGDWYSATLVGGGLEPGVDYDAFIMPNKNPDLPPALYFEAGPLVVGENSPNKEDAKKVAEWWMSVPAQDEWNSLMGFSPANSKAAAPTVVGQGVADWINANNAQLVLRYWEATPPDIVETAVDEFARFMVNPDQYMSVLEAIQAKADQVWAERG